MARAALAAPGRLDGRAFNIGTGVETSVVDLARTLGTAAGRPVSVEQAPARTGEQLRSAVVVDKAAKVLGWQPRVTLEQGLRDTYHWFAEQHATARTPATSGTGRVGTR